VERFVITLPGTPLSAKGKKEGANKALSIIIKKLKIS